MNDITCAVYGCERKADQEAHPDFDYPKNAGTSPYRFSMICTPCQEAIESDFPEYGPEGERG